LWFVAPRAVEVRTGVAPDLPPGGVLLRAVASGVSQGTELLLFRGEGPSPFDPSLEPASVPTYPRRYGYAWVGEVVALGQGITAPSVGTRAFALAPHGDLHAMAAADLRILDPAIPPTRAVLAANLETAVTCVWDSGVSIGDHVVVLGGGVVGLLTTWILSAAGARVRLVEPSPRRRELGRALGAVAALSPGDDIPTGDADAVVEATGDPRVLDDAILYAGREATVVVASFYGSRAYPVHLGAEFHRRRLTLRASQVSTIPPSRAPRWDALRRFEVVHRLLHDPSLDALIDPCASIEDAARVYARLDAAPGESAQTVFDYEGG
jgi:2-desacetyl-2-hydroxyethyl bacteriochlorophyllide A dehydrogenase